MDLDEAAQLRRTVNRLARQFNAAADDAGLTPTQASILGLVAGFGPVGLSALARMEHVHPTMLSRVVNHLEGARLVVRRPDPDDLRAVVVECTEAGKSVHQRVLANRADVVMRGAASLAPVQLRAVSAALPALEALVAAIAKSERTPDAEIVSP